MTTISTITHKDYSVSGYDGLVLMLYHITDLASARAIESSQMMKPGKGGMLGAGIYFADTKEAADKKALRKGVVLKCLVKVGKIMVLSRECNYNITLDKLEALGVNSIKSVEHNTGSEYVVYKSSQVVSAWVVEGAPEKVLFPANETDSRTVCEYGKECKRKNPIHFQRFKHPLAPKFPMRIPIPMQKEKCKYGENCYNTNIEHFERYSHPPSVTTPGLKCPYGMRCYRKNPEHFKKYIHPPSHPFYRSQGGGYYHY